MLSESEPSADGIGISLRTTKHRTTSGRNPPPETHGTPNRRMAKKMTEEMPEKDLFFAFL